MAEHSGRNTENDAKQILTPLGEEKISVGEQLRKQRKARGISLVEVSEHTKIGKRYLEALENCEYNQLPGETYIRGFLRAYAKYLEMDDESLLRQYHEHKLQEAEQVENPAEGNREKRDTSPSWLGALVAVLVLAGLGVGIFIFWPVSLKMKTESKTETLAVQAPSNEKSAAVVSAINANEEMTLKVRAKEKTWITLMTDGRQEPDVTLNMNEERTWTAKDRFVLWTGNAGGIEVTFCGELQPPLGQSGEVRKEVIFERMPQSNLPAPTPLAK